MRVNVSEIWQKIQWFGDKFWLVPQNPMMDQLEIHFTMSQEVNLVRCHFICSACDAPASVCMSWCLFSVDQGKIESLAQTSLSSCLLANLQEPPWWSLPSWYVDAAFVAQMEGEGGTPTNDLGHKFCAPIHLLVFPSSERHDSRPHEP